MIAVSTGRADITPTAMAEMGGYATATTPRLATGTYSPLSARVLILWWDDEPHAIVTLDAGTLPPAWHQALRPRLVALTGWASADIAILATHTHNAPMTLSHPDPWITYAATDLGLCAAYWSDLADTVVQLVTDALDGWQTPVTLDYLSTTQPWSDSRTQPKTYKETAVPVLAARDLSGRLVAVLFGFGTHAVTAGQQTKWDGDYPSAACAVIEAGIPGCHAQFIPGPGGDQNPTSMGTWGIRNMLGTQLGSAVVTAVNTPGRPLVAPITTSLTSVSVPLEVPANPAERAARRAEYVARHTVNAALYDAVPYYRRHAPIAIGQIDAGTDAHTIDIPIQVWRLGVPTLRILLLGGEPVSGYGKWARDHYGGVNNIMVGGYANEVSTYVVGNTFYQPVDTNGSYEGAWNTLDPRCAGESGCVYGWCWHSRPGLGPQDAEPTILAALTAALA